MTVMITYAGAPAIYAGARRVRLVQHIAALPDGDPVKRFVCVLGIFERDVRAGVIDGQFTQERAELFARLALMDDELFASLSRGGASDREIAEIFRVPIEQVECKRRDLELLDGTDRPSDGPNGLADG